MTTSKRHTERKTVWEHLQFRLLFITVFVWFLGQAVITRVKLVRQHELNCWQEAKRAAHSVAPYAFMKIKRSVAPGPTGLEIDKSAQVATAGWKKGA